MKPLLALGALTAVAALLIAVTIIGIPFEHRLASSSISLESGHAYFAPLKQLPWPLAVRSDGPSRGHRSEIEIREDGIALGPAHAKHDAIRHSGQGRYSHWRKSLYFSSSDGSDPRHNGKRYVVVLRVRLAPEFSFAVIIGLGLGMRRILVQGLNRGLGWLRQTVALSPEPRAHPPNARSAYPLFVSLIVLQLIIGASCAPMISVDSFGLAAAAMSDFVIPHFPPLYPMFVRSINLVVHNLSVFLGLSSIEGTYTWSLYRPPPYTNVSAYVVILLQHALLAGAAGWFAVSITRRRWLRVGAALLLCWSPSTVLAAQRIQTEGLWHPLVIMAMAFSARFLAYSDKPLKSLTLHFLFVGLAMLVRHPGSVFLSLLPLSVLTLGIARTVRERRVAAVYPSLKPTLVVSCIGLGVLLLVSLIKTAVLVAYEVEPRSVAGRAGTYRIHASHLSPFEGMTHADLDGVLETLEQRAEDPRVRRAIRTIATSESVWVDAYNDVRREIIEPALPDYGYRQSIAATDRLLNDVHRLVYTSTDPRVLRAVVIRTTRMLQIGPGITSSAPLGISMAEAARATDRAWLESEAFIRVTAAKDLKRVRRSLILGRLALRAQPIEARSLWIAIACFAAAAMLRDCFGRVASLGGSIAASAVIYSLLMSIASVYIIRYSEIIVVLGASALVALISVHTDHDCSDRRPDRRPDEASPAPREVTDTS